MTWVGKLIWGIAVTVTGDEMFYTDKSIILSMLEEIFKKLHVVMVFCNCFLSPIFLGILHPIVWDTSGQKGTWVIFTLILDYVNIFYT